MKRRFSTFSTIQSFVKVENFVFLSSGRLVFLAWSIVFIKKRPLTLARGTLVPFLAFCGLKPPCDLLHAVSDTRGPRLDYRSDPWSSKRDASPRFFPALSCSQSSSLPSMHPDALRCLVEAIRYGSVSAFFFFASPVPISYAVVSFP